MSMVEDGIRFPHNCPRYTGTRERFPKAIIIMNSHFKDLDCNNQFLFLMKSESYILQNVMAEYITDLFQVKTSIIQTIVKKIGHDLHHDFSPPGLNVAIVINVKICI